MPSIKRVNSGKKFNPKWSHAATAISVERKLPTSMNVSQFELLLRKKYPKLALGNRTLLAFCGRNNIGTRKGNVRLLSRQDMIRLNRIAARTADLFHSGDFLTAKELATHPAVQMTKSGVHLRVKALSTWVIDPKTGERKLMPKHVPFIKVGKGETLGAPNSAKLLFPKHVAQGFASLSTPLSPEQVAKREARQLVRRRTGRSMAQIQAEAAERQKRIAAEKEERRLAREARRAEDQLLKKEADRKRKAEADRKRRKKAEEKRKKAAEKKAADKRKPKAKPKTRASSPRESKPTVSVRTRPEVQAVPKPAPVAPAEPPVKPNRIPTLKEMDELNEKRKTATDVPAQESLLREIRPLIETVNEMYRRIEEYSESDRSAIISAKASLDVLEIDLSWHVKNSRKSGKSADGGREPSVIPWMGRRT